MKPIAIAVLTCAAVAGCSPKLEYGSGGRSASDAIRDAERPAARSATSSPAAHPKMVGSDSGVRAVARRLGARFIPAPAGRIAEAVRAEIAAAHRDTRDPHDVIVVMATTASMGATLAELRDSLLTALESAVLAGSRFALYRSGGQDPMTSFMCLCPSGKPPCTVPGPLCRPGLDASIMSARLFMDPLEILPTGGPALLMLTAADAAESGVRGGRITHVIVVGDSTVYPERAAETRLRTALSTGRIDLSFLGVGAASGGETFEAIDGPGAK